MPKALSYIRTRTNNDIWNNDKRVCSCKFHSLSELFSGTIISPVRWMPDRFPLKRYNDHFPTCTSDMWKCRKFSHKIYPAPRSHFHDVLVLWLTGHCSSVPGFVNPLVDVPLELWACKWNLSCWSIVYVWNYGLKQISRTRIRLPKFSF